MRAQLERKGWQQQTLADTLGISKAAMSQLLNGDYAKIPPSLLQALDALGLQLVVQPKPAASAPSSAPESKSTGSTTHQHWRDPSGGQC